MRSFRSRPSLWLALILLVLLYLAATYGVNLYTDWLWFRSLNQAQVFTTIIGAQVLLFLAVGLLFWAFFAANLLIAYRLATDSAQGHQPRSGSRRLVFWAMMVPGLVFGWIAGAVASSQWLVVLQYLNRRPFQLSDPVFGLDVGFYLFSIPFFHLLQGILLALLILTLLGVAAVHLSVHRKWPIPVRLFALPQTWVHLALLTSAVFAVLAWGHRLAMYELLYSGGASPLVPALPILTLTCLCFGSHSCWLA